MNSRVRASPQHTTAHREATREGRVGRWRMREVALGFMSLVSFATHSTCRAISQPLANSGQQLAEQHRCAFCNTSTIEPTTQHIESIIRLIMNFFPCHGIDNDKLPPQNTSIRTTKPQLVLPKGTLPVRAGTSSLRGPGGSTARCHPAALVAAAVAATAPGLQLCTARRGMGVGRTTP